jgi:hydrogenase expression/formation protein HypC
MGKIDYGGITRDACLEYISDAELGDYVMVHVGFAISKVDEEEAARTYKYLEELDQLQELDTPEPDIAPRRATESRDGDDGAEPTLATPDDKQPDSAEEPPR